MNRKEIIALLVFLGVITTSANNLMAQEINRMSYHYGASFKMTSDPFLYEVSPSIGVGFVLIPVIRSVWARRQILVFISKIRLLSEVTESHY